MTRGKVGCLLAVIEASGFFSLEYRTAPHPLETPVKRYLQSESNSSSMYRLNDNHHGDILDDVLLALIQMP